LSLYGEKPVSYFATFKRNLYRYSAEKDRRGLVDSSIALGFLTGEEPEVLIDAHCEAGFQVGKPFAAEGSYDFALNRDMTRRVAGRCTLNQVDP
jgi:hypothetical protein